jgi:hypothetical protein
MQVAALADAPHTTPHTHPTHASAPDAHAGGSRRRQRARGRSSRRPRGRCCRCKAPQPSGVRRCGLTPGRACPTRMAAPGTSPCHGAPPEIEQMKAFVACTCTTARLMVCLLVVRCGLAGPAGLCTPLSAGWRRLRVPDARAGAPRCTAAARPCRACGEGWGRCHQQSGMHFLAPKAGVAGPAAREKQQGKGHGHSLLLPRSSTALRQGHRALSERGAPTPRPGPGSSAHVRAA